MKKLSAVVFLLIGFLSNSQPPPVRMASAGSNPLTNSVNILYDRTTIAVNEEAYMINGEEVIGFPFLYYNWSNGTVIIADGKTYSNYKLKYNIYNQTIFFSDGKDSLEAVDPIKEFYLLIPDDKGQKKYSFVHTSMFQKTKKSFYYEVMADSTNWELLKVNRKVVKTMTNALPVYKGKKVFQLETEYFFYDKQEKKIIPVKADWSRFADALKLSEADKTRLGAQAYDFTKESDITRFFELFTRPKAF